MNYEKELLELGQTYGIEPYRLLEALTGNIAIKTKSPLGECVEIHHGSTFTLKYFCGDYVLEKWLSSPRRIIHLSMKDYGKTWAISKESHLLEIKKSTTEIPFNKNVKVL